MEANPVKRFDTAGTTPTSDSDKRRTTVGAISDACKTILRVPLHNKLKKIQLPPSDAWGRLIYPSSATQAQLKVSLRSNDFHPFRSKLSGLKRCVLSAKGYLVIYCGDKSGQQGPPIGYALDIRDAEKFTLSKKSSKQGTKTPSLKAKMEWSFAVLTLSPSSFAQESHNACNFEKWTDSLLRHYCSRRQTG